MSTAAAPLSWKELARRSFPAALDLLFPCRCLSCGIRLVEEVAAGGVCHVCWRELPRLPGERCPVCDDPMPRAERSEAYPCGRCAFDPPAFSALRSATPYAGTARAILAAFKFRGADFLAEHLARLVVERCGSRGERAPFDEVTCVPAERLSLWRRDHPARLLAEAVARRLDLPFAPDRLRKWRRTRKQSRLPLSRRPANVRGAFQSAGAPDSVLLVDDVATSGATARECARALRRAGAEHVEVWCFARAARDRALVLDAGGLREAEPEVIVVERP